MRRLERHLRSLDVEPASIQAIFITHDHRDHVAALKVGEPFPQRYRIPVYGMPGFWRNFSFKERIDDDLRRVVSAGDSVDIDGCLVRPFRKPHDAWDPVGYTVECGFRRISILTDLGFVPREVLQHVEDSTFLVLESNHDVDMEMNSGRSPFLIRRVLSDVGHLSNEQAAAALAIAVGKSTRLVLLAHLSLDCNTPEMALKAALRAVRRKDQVTIEVAPPDRPSCFFSERGTF